MHGIFNTKTKKFKTYEGWTEYDNKNNTINDLRDVMLFTNKERKLNVLKKPLEWRQVNPRVNWKMFK